MQHRWVQTIKISHFINASVFITGTDTNVGKTYIACKILQNWQQFKFKTLGLKPISSGHTLIGGEQVNADAYLLRQAATEKLPLHEVNPVSFAEFIAPHIAAKKHTVQLSVAGLMQAIERQLQVNYDYCVVEGAGGWQVPLNQTETMADFAKQLGLPVILVVSIKLGCINHALLTYQSIKAKGLGVYGWVANCIVAMDINLQQENIATIAGFIAEPLIAIDAW